MKKPKLPKTDSIDDLARFCDTHDLTDFEDELEEVTDPVFVRVLPKKSGAAMTPSDQPDRPVAHIRSPRLANREDAIHFRKQVSEIPPMPKSDRIQCDPPGRNIQEADKMITASELAGFFAAHTVWTLSDADGFAPILAYTNAAGLRQMSRFVGDDAEKSVAHGREQLASNKLDATDAVLLYDGRITIGDEKVDAIIIELRAYFSPDSEAVLAVPYTPASSGKFLVHKPKLLEWKNCDDFDMNAAIQAFFDGVDKHEKGSKIWSECLDESR